MRVDNDRWRLLKGCQLKGLSFRGVSIKGNVC